MIEGVELVQKNILENEDGAVYHHLKSSEDAYCGFGETYLSSVVTGRVKAWKLHTEMVCNIVVPVGAVKFVLIDERKNSNTRGETMEVVISRQNYKRITIPNGIWFGFQGIGDGLNLLVNVASIEHRPDEVERRAVDAIEFNWEKI